MHTTLHHLAHRNRSIRSICVAMMVIIFATGGACGEGIMIVVSSESSPYTAAAKSCASYLSRNGRDVEVVSLESIDVEAIKVRSDPTVAVGGKAAVALNESLPHSSQLFYCMTPSPDLIGLPEREHTSGISTEPDFTAVVSLIDQSGITVRRIGMLYRSRNASSLRNRDQFAMHLPENWSLESIDVDKAGSASKSIDLLFGRDIDLVWTSADAAVYNSSLVKALLLRALREHVPVFGFSHALVRAGAPIGVGFVPDNQGERVARLIVENRLGVHEPSDPDLAINYTVLSRINLDLDNSFIRKAKVKYGDD